MTQLWYIVVPETATNLVLNPSAERTGNYTTNGTVTRSTSFAYSGFNSFFLDSFASTHYFRLTVPALANAVHTISLSLKATDAVSPLRVSVDGTNYYTIGSDFTLWDGDPTDPNGARYYRTFLAAQCSGKTYIEILGPALTVLSVYVDAIQCEAADHPTTYIDCDTQGCYATGERHASTSYRVAQERSGGRVYTLDSYSVIVSPASNRFGDAPIENNAQMLALQPGAEYLGYRTLPRDFSLAISLSGSSLANLHSLRNALTAIIEPDAVRDEQAFIIGYQGANSTRKAWFKARYVSGLEFNGIRGFLEEPVLRLVANDPFIYEWGVCTHALAFTQTVTSTRFTRRSRTTNEWAAIGGLNGDVYAEAYDYERGRVYLAGTFTTGTTSGGAGQTLNRVAYWDGTYMVALADGANIGVNNTVNCLAIAPNGDVWFGGLFTTAGGLPCDKLARWGVAASQWGPVTFSAGTITEIFALATSKTGLLYIGGNFINVGSANGDYIVSYDGTTETALSTGSNAAVQNIIVASDGTVYAFSYQGTSMGGVTGLGVWAWNGTAFTALSQTLSVSNYLSVMFESEDGRIFIAGTDTINVWNGTSLITLYDFGDIIWALTPYGGNKVLVSLATTTDIFGGSDYHVLWTGTSFVLPDFISTSGGQLRSLAIQPNQEERGDPEVFMAHGGVTINTAGETTTITANCTAKTSPVFLLTGPTTAGTSCRLQTIENMTTGETLYFSLSVNAGEYAIIDCRTGIKGVFSAWAGRPGGQGVFTRSVDLTGGGLNAGAGRRVSGQPLPASDFGSFHLQRGSNVIGAFVSGTTTGVTLTMAYVPKHSSVDGVA